MPGNLLKNPSLLIVSDTPMWKISTGNIAYEPVIREIEAFAHLFSSITWIGFQYDNQIIQKNARAPSVKIKFIFLEKVGGKKLVDKLMIIRRSLQYFWIVKTAISQADVIHTRGPSLTAFMVILISLFNNNRIYWHKYAGNWIESNPPFSYRLQKLFLKYATNTKVVINGSWPNLPKHILNFKNPCVSKKHFEQSGKILDQKDFSGKLSVCFVGNLEHFKGCGKIILALNQMGPLEKIERFLIIGSGTDLSNLKELAKTSKVKIEFTGYLQRKEIDEIYKWVHLIILPSQSEGFPKVIAEAGVYGCVPIVSNISSISQVIEDGINGFLLDQLDSNNISSKIETFLRLSLEKKKEMAINASQSYFDFSYEHFVNRISKDILS